MATASSWPERNALPAHLAGAAGAAFLTLVGQTGWFGEVSGEIAAWAIELVAIAVATAAVAWWVRQSFRDADAGTLAMRALILGALACLSIPVFWLGLHAVFAVGALLLGLKARQLDRDGFHKLKVSGAFALAAMGFVVSATGNLAG